MTTTTKKFWNIRSTEHYSEVKEELKTIRTALNLANNIVEKNVPASQWPFRITKGPDHPKLSPYFREVPIGAEFKTATGVHYRKIDAEISKNISEDGMLGAGTHKFHQNTQVHSI